MFQNKAAVSAGARATHTIPQDFCRIFAEDQTALYLLSLVLTADSEKAEQCFVADWKTPSTGIQSGADSNLRGMPLISGRWDRTLAAC